MLKKKKEIEADAIDLELDRLARRCRARWEDSADGDQRWGNAYVAINGARRAVRAMMAPKRRAETEG